MSVRMRQEVEHKIVRAAITAILAAGYAISVDNGDNGEYENAANPEGFAIHQSTHLEAILSAMFQTDQETLLVWSPTQKRNIGSIFLVYGNEGYDVISDYAFISDYASTRAIDEMLLEANNLADYYDADGPYITYEDWKQNKAEAAAERAYDRSIG